MTKLTITTLWAVLVLLMLTSGCDTRTGEVVATQTELAAISELPQAGIDAPHYSLINESKDLVAESGESYTMEYVQITGLHETALEDAINEELFAATIGIFEPYAAFSSGMQAAEYVVYCRSDEYLSIMCDYNFDADEGAKYGHMRFAITIDMRTGERVSLSQIAQDEERLRRLLNDFEYENPTPINPPVSPEDVDNMMTWAMMSEKDYLSWWIEHYNSEPHGQWYVMDILRDKPTFVITPDELIITRSAFPSHDVAVALSSL